MRILHVIGTMSPAAGGPTMVVSRLACAQALLGHEPSILFYAEPASTPGAALIGLPGAASVSLHALPPPSRGERLLGWSARKAAPGLVANADIVHTHGVWERLAHTCAAVARARHTPYAIAPHGMIDPWALAQKGLKKKLALALGVRSVIRDAAFIHANSDYERDSIRAAGFHDDVVTISNGVFLEEFADLPPRDAFARRPELGGRPYILFLARLHPGKGADLLTDAYARLLPAFPELRLVIVGPDFGAERALRERIARLSLADRVVLTGQLLGRDKLAALAGAAVLCLPSEHESFGISLAEAMACRVPIVMTDTCHLGGVREYGAGVVVSRTVDTIARGLERVLADPVAALAMGEQGRRLIEDRYTWQAVAQRSIETYARAIAKTREMLGGGRTA